MFGRKLDLNPASNAGNKGGHWIRRFPKDKTAVMLRPLAEPEDEAAWMTYTMVWDKSIQGGRGWPLPTGGLAEDHQEVTTKHIAAMLDLEDDRVVVFQLPRSVVDGFGERFKRRGTITDRDYVITRKGAGKESTYALMDDEPVARDLSVYEVPNLEQVLVDAYQHAVDEGWAKPLPGIAAAADDGFTDMEDSAPVQRLDAVRTTPYELDEVKDLPLGELRAALKAMQINPSGLSKQEIIDALTDADAF